MLELRDIQATTKFGLDRVVITYEFEDTNENMSNYTLNLYKSYSGIDDSYFLQQSDIDFFRTEDWDVDLLDENIKYFYKIEFVNIETGETELSKKFAMLKVKEPDRWGHAIAAMEKVYLENVIRNPNMYLLKKIRSGGRCFCFDDIRMVSDPKCKLCYGTSYVGGYEKATPIKVNFANAEQYTQSFDLSNMQGEERSGLQLWTSNYPIIQAEDVLVDDDNIRWRITSVTPTTKGKFILRQILTIEMIQKTDIVYKVSVEEKI